MTPNVWMWSSFLIAAGSFAGFMLGSLFGGLVFGQFAGSTSCGPFGLICGGATFGLGGMLLGGGLAYFVLVRKR